MGMIYDLVYVAIRHRRSVLRIVRPALGKEPPHFGVQSTLYDTLVQRTVWCPILPQLLGQHTEGRLKIGKRLFVCKQLKDIQYCKIELKFGQTSRTVIPKL